MVQITEARNARSMNAENTHFDVEINHPDYGWIPYALTPWDTDNTINNTDLLALIGSDYVAFSQADEDARQAEFSRYQRDSRLENDVDPIVTNPLRWAELTTEKQNEWTQYRTDLLNVPQQAGFPNTINWPTKPE
jgi:hypothetical protein